MKVVIVGANGTIGSKITSSLKDAGLEVIAVGKSRGDYQADISDSSQVAELFKKIGNFDALVNASGDVSFAPLVELNAREWSLSLANKLMGQINLVQQAIPYLSERGSITLVSGITSERFIRAGTVATTVNRAIEGFVQSAATELPKSLRINVVSPNLLQESAQAYGPYFPGFVPVEGKLVAQAFLRSVMGVETGQIYKVF